MPSHCQGRFCSVIIWVLIDPVSFRLHRGHSSLGSVPPAAPPAATPPHPVCLNLKVPLRLLCQELPCSTRPGCSIPSSDREPSSLSEGRGRGRDFCLGRVQGSEPGFESIHISFMTLVCVFFLQNGATESCPKDCCDYFMIV